jgi:hypothetical protein
MWEEAVRVEEGGKRGQEDFRAPPNEIAGELLPLATTGVPVQ